MTPDILLLFKKRIYDLAGVLGSSVKVSLDDTVI
jgi:hypothetical protein